MIVKEKDFLYKADTKGDNFAFTHMQKVDTIQGECHQLREFGGNGWSEDKGFRHIARIPDLDAARLAAERPGIFQDTTGNMLRDWLKKEGKPYLTVKGGI